MGFFANIISLALAAVFLLAGVTKLSPVINPDLTQMHTENFQNRYAPYWSQFAGPLAEMPNFAERFQFLVGLVEVLGAAMMLFTPFGPLAVLPIIVCATVTHVVLEDPVEMSAVAGTIALLVVIRLALGYGSAAPQRKRKQA